MNHRPRRLSFLWAFSGLLLLVSAGSARADFVELLRRAPDSANTIIMIDVERLFMSPIAMKEKWRDKNNSDRGESLHFPVNSKRYMLVSKLNMVSDFENLWDAALIEPSDPFSLSYLAKREGGYLDKVEGMEIAYSPRNAFFVSLTPTILGVAFPANRQDLSRWLRWVQKRNEPDPSEYFHGAMLEAHGNAQIVAAFDLTNLFTNRMIRDRLHNTESLAGKNVDMDALTKVLTSIRGLTFTVEATERLTGKLRIDLAESPTPLKEVAKPIILEVLENRGLLLDHQMKDWAI